MTRFHTGNPVGSSSPLDLYDNAENLDSAINGESLDWLDRLGVPRRSWAGFKSDFDDFVDSNRVYGFPTWAAAAAAVAAGQVPVQSEVNIVGDAGTHVDPVTGATVSNSGRFTMTADGLQWRSPDTLSQKAEKTGVSSEIAQNSSSDGVAILIGRPTLGPGSGMTPGGNTLADLRGFPVDGYLSELAIYANANGSAKLKILARSLGGDLTATVVAEHVVQIRPGINTLVAGRDFPTTYVQAGWTWGAYTDVALLSRASDSPGETLSVAGDASTATYAVSSFGTMWQARLIAGPRAGLVADSATDIAMRAAGVAGGASWSSQELTAPSVASAGFTRVIQYGFPEDTVIDSVTLMAATGGGYGRLKVLQKNPADLSGTFDVISAHAFRPVVGNNVLTAGRDFPKGLTVPKNGALAVYTSLATLHYDTANSNGAKAASGDVGGAGVVFGGSAAALRFNLSVRHSVPVMGNQRTLLAEYFQRASDTVAASGAWDFTGEGVLSPTGGDAVLYRPEYSTLDPVATTIRFRVVEPGASFGVGRRSPELYGTVAMYDATQGKLQLFLWASGSSSIPSVPAKEVDVPFAFSVGEEGAIELRHVGRINTATLTKSRTRESVSVVTGNPGDGDSGRCWGQPCVIARAGRVRFLSLTYRLLTSRRPRLVCGVDSITEGFNLGSSSWGQRWGNLLRDENAIEVVFAARGGGNTVDLLRRATLDIAALRPDFYSLLCITNERNEAPIGNVVAWKARMQMVVAAIRASGATPVLMTAPPTGEAADAAFINSANGLILAGAFGPARVVDFAAALTVNGDRVTQDVTLFLEDLVHPNVAGHRRMADQFVADVPELID